MPIRYLIIDDEPLAHRVLLKYAASLPVLQLAGQCYDAEQARAVLGQEPLDLVFLDIRMPGQTGLDLLRGLAYPPQVILATAHAEYALDGFECNVADYLLKPFSEARFLTAVQRAAGQLQAQEPAFILLKEGRGYHRLPHSAVFYLKGMGGYTRVFHEGGVLTAQGNLRSILSGCPSVFLRIHKSYAVHTAHVTKVAGSRLWAGGEALPIGEAYREMVYRALGLAT
ncbi:LytR/AlgR family response regulator transcription factor [Phaeodactylibacter luteus]|uniref:Response regulator transcription factor n=1 Tax=Phaeodactylibacter luteus TaxID=1564516 RepID=A0A5C6RI42_9BACT|nr:response regulator transcription factor [Phaeodactylibacter luteus]TXB62108.1 response regulator transcription factor [Phaeodactylibacter luteus]